MTKDHDILGINTCICVSVLVHHCPFAAVEYTQLTVMPSSSRFNVSVAKLMKLAVFLHLNTELTHLKSLVQMFLMMIFKSVCVCVLHSVFHLK